MKTSVIAVHDMLSVWSVDEVERRMGEVPGVESVTVNFAAKSATVRYDETRLEIADIRSAVRQNGYESGTPTAASAGAGRQDHIAAGEPPAIPAPAGPKTALIAPASAGAHSPGAAPPDKASPSTAAATPGTAAAKPSPTAPTPAAPQPTAAAGKKQQDTTVPDKS